MKEKFNIIIVIYFLVIGFLFFIFVNNPDIFLLPFAKGTKIVIDPGHGGADPGAMRGGICEKDINLAIAKKLKKYLIKQGFRVIMTRETDKGVSLWRRVYLVNKEKPALFISIHANTSPDNRLRGSEVYYYTPKSRDFAIRMHGSFYHNSLITRDKSIFRARYYVIRFTNVPAILVEVGYMSNYEEKFDLLDDNRQTKITKAIAKGIRESLTVQIKK